MPSCKTYNQHTQRRQQDAVGQNGLFVAEKPVTPVGTQKSQQRHGNDKVCPCRGASANAGNQQQFSRTGESGEHSEQESSSSSPQGSPRPEPVTGPPIKCIRAKDTERQSDGKRDGHRVDRVTMYRNTRFRFFEPRQLADRVNQVLLRVFLAVFGHVTILVQRFVPALAFLTLTGCEGVLSTVDPAGPAAQTIATLWWVMLTGASLIFALVMILLAMAFRGKNVGDDARRVRVWIVGLGLVFPMAVLASLLSYGLTVGERLLPREGPDVVKVGAQGRLSAWTFSYEDAPNLSTDGTLHIPAGRPVDVAITTADVIHSFWVPRLAGKLDAIPGRTNVLRIEADDPGTYSGVSAEFSGSGYDSFTFSVIAHDTASWVAFMNGGAE